MTPIPVVIDSDAGTDVDDALALALALASPEIDLLGVTIVDGDVNLRARIVARLLGQLGRPDIPVVPGSSHPLGPGRMPTMRGHEGRGILDVDYNGPEAVILDQGAAEWLVELSHELPVHVVAIGPYTNIARALQLDPSLAQRLTHLTVMGGMVDASRYTSAWKAHFARNGVTGAWLDHNSASDPEAALICATSGVPMTWVTAELTFCTPIFEAAIDDFSATRSIPGETLARLLRVWADEWFHYVGPGQSGPSPFPAESVACLHDPLALASLFLGAWLTLQDMTLQYSVEDDLFRTIPSTAGATASVSTAVDAPAFEAFVVQRILGLLLRQA